MDFKKMLDAIIESNRKVRGDYHLTLGGAIEAVKGAPKDALVQFSHGGSPTGPHSYRGYYSDLSFASTSGEVTAGRFLTGLEDCLGRTFQGYKGGDFVMGEDTPLWSASRGNLGPAIIDAIMIDGKIILVTKDVD